MLTVTLAVCSVRLNSSVPCVAIGLGYTFKSACISEEATYVMPVGALKKVLETKAPLPCVPTYTLYALLHNHGGRVCCFKSATRVLAMPLFVYVQLPPLMLVVE